MDPLVSYSLCFVSHHRRIIFDIPRSGLGESNANIQIKCACALLFFMSLSIRGLYIPLGLAASYGACWKASTVFCLYLRGDEPLC